MAKTIITKDGKCHVLVGNTTLESVVREYAGDEPADLVKQALERNVRAEYKAQTDLGAYEEELNTLHGYMRDWVEELRRIAFLCGDRKVTKATLRDSVLSIISSIENEM